MWDQHESEVSGTIQEIALKAGCLEQELSRSIQQLIDYKIADVINSNPNVIIKCRRLEKLKKRRNDIKINVARFRSKSICNPTGNHIESESESESESEKNKKAADAPVDNSINEEIEKTTEHLYKAKWPKVIAWKNTQLKKGRNPKAILHTLKRAIEVTHPDYWAYCTKTRQEEDKNYNADDSEKQCQKYKQMPVNLKSILVGIK